MADDRHRARVSGHVALAQLASRGAPERVYTRANQDGATDPEREALLAESVGLALLVVLEKLAPAERLAFVLHDMFAVFFDEIAPIVGRSAAAARQLASRARRRVHGAATVRDPDLSTQRGVVDAFLAALRGGNFDGLLAMLQSEVVVRAESAEGVREIRGCAKLGKGRAGVRAARPFHATGAS